MKNLLFAFVAMSLLQACATSKGKQATIFANTDGAINGYDPVAYFTVGKPTKGTAANTYKWEGATWHFASAENKAAFVQNPQKYAPQYGGYCAYGWSEGHPAPTQPDAWTIVGDKLYLNYNKEVVDLWKKDVPGNIKKADVNYQKSKQ